VSEYDATTEAIINANFITGLNSPFEVLVSGDDLFVTCVNATVAEYNAKTGAVINGNFISGLNSPFGVAVKASK
jgi:hypothetical protein